MKIFTVLALAGALLGASALPSRATEKSVEITQRHLYAGTLADGEKELADIVARSPDDAEAVAGLGVVRLARSVERLSQSLYRHGLRPTRVFPMDAPMFRMPLPENPSPEPIAYEDFRAILKTMISDLEAVDKTLEPLGGKPMKLPLAIGNVRLNLTGQSGASTTGNLYDIYNALLLNGAGNASQAGNLIIVFDESDVLWLRGYTHLLRAPAEFLLARDWHLAFEGTFHRMFPGVTSPVAAELMKSRSSSTFLGPDDELADSLSFIHLINWPVIEPDRLPKFRDHLKAMIALNQQMWASIRAETDNDREWLPNSKQMSLIPQMEITDERIDAWLAMVVELDAVLDGKKLIPHWRFDKGLNLRKLVESPAPFDLVLTLTGPGAIPYLENGPETDMRIWMAMDAVFDGDFTSYAAWIN